MGLSFPDGVYLTPQAMAPSLICTSVGRQRNSGPERERMERRLGFPQSSGAARLFLALQHLPDALTGMAETLAHRQHQGAAATPRLIGHDCHVPDRMIQLGGGLPGVIAIQERPGAA